jgi:uncharacterized protein
MTNKLPKKLKQGFAAMSLEQRREISPMGGKAVPPEKRAFAANPELAAKAGRIGGKNLPAEDRGFSRNPALGAAVGGKGGRASPAR